MWSLRAPITPQSTLKLCRHHQIQQLLVRTTSEVHYFLKSEQQMSCSAIELANFNWGSDRQTWICPYMQIFVMWVWRSFGLVLQANFWPRWFCGRTTGEHRALETCSSHMACRRHVRYRVQLRFSSSASQTSFTTLKVTKAANSPIKIWELWAHRE